MLARGVRARAIYSSDALDVPGQLETLEFLMEAGEEARVFPFVPVKLAIADGKIGLAPLRISEEGLAGAVLVHESPLLDALVMLFELVWQRAAPIGSFEGEAVFGHEEERILSLMVAGLKDQSIARQLGIGLSTVERRVRAMMQQLGARTRFQAGYQAGLLAGRAEGSDPSSNG
jgi:DNA-binding CsgD family transcriptional regulator